MIPVFVDFANSLINGFFGHLIITGLDLSLNCIAPNLGVLRTIS